MIPPITFFTMVYMLIGLVLGVGFLNMSKDQIKTHLDMDDVPEMEGKIIQYVIGLMFVFGWPVMLVEMGRRR